MVTVRRLLDGQTRRVGHMIVRRASSWRVLPDCRGPFAKELRATGRFKASAIALLALPRRRRLLYLPRLWQLRRASLIRRLGKKAAARNAWSITLQLLVARRQAGPADGAVAFPGVATETPPAGTGPARS